MYSNTDIFVSLKQSIKGLAIEFLKMQLETFVQGKKNN